MDLNGILKEIRIFFRNRTVSVTLLFMVILETAIILQSVKVIPEGAVSPFFSFSLFQRHLILMFFPCLLVNILIIAFSVTSEKQNGMLSRLIPGGESSMIRNKTTAATVISLFLSVTYIFLALIACGLKMYLNYRFVIFISVSYFFLFSGLSSFSVAFAFMFYRGNDDFEPEPKQMLVYSLFMTAAVLLFYYFLSVNLRYFYEFVTGYRRMYPNMEFISFMIITFCFMTGSRIMLKKAEKKLSGEQY